MRVRIAKSLMTDLAIAATAAKAWGDDCPKARTQADAAAKAGAPVTLAVEPLPDVFDSAEAAFGAAPDSYVRGAEVIFMDGVWRVMVRFWRPLPALPVAATALAALKAPLGAARTETEAVGVALGPVVEVREPAPWRYASRKKAMAKWAAQIEAGLADLSAAGDRFQLMVRFWQPVIADGKRDLKARLAAPLRAALPQSPLDIGLFEQRAPENPEVVLAEEGDGRRHQE